MVNFFNQNKKRFLSFFVLVFLFLFSISAFSKNVYIYISPTGSDAADGMRPESAIKSLDRVKNIFKNFNNLRSGDIVDVIFMPGKYHGLSVIWDVFKVGVSINFRPYENTDTVMIDGENSNGKFFILRLKKEHVRATSLVTNINFMKIRLMNYCEGISFGDWKSDVIVINNRIEDVTFQNVGSKYDPVKTSVNGVLIPLGSCVAAVRLQNAQKSILINNKFLNIENLPQRQTKAGKYGPLLMHAIYIADDASDNIIRANFFKNFTGSPIRIRNSSDRTMVVDNTFEKPIYVSAPKGGYLMKAVSQWYCNQEVNECVGKEPECPSIGTILSNNYIGQDLELYSDESQSKNSTCPVEKLRLRNIKNLKEIEFR
jgi:Right handed beta helix region